MPNNEKRGGAGNFANDPQKASEAGKKGGERRHSGQKQHEQGQQGGIASKAARAIATKAAPVARAISADSGRPVSGGPFP